MLQYTYIIEYSKYQITRYYFIKLFILIFLKKKVFGLCKLCFYHLRAYDFKIYNCKAYNYKAYNCKTYIFIKSKNDAQYLHKYQKLNTKAYIGFLVSYK